VVLVQGAGDRRVAVRLRAAGAAAVLDLPLDLRQLLDVVTRFLNRPTPGAP
jgi:FixJ family two-component response regulator